MSAYQPKTGAKCGCRRGVQRDNCPHCEGTGMVIDFQAIRARGGEDMTQPAKHTPGPWYPHYAKADHCLSSSVWGQEPGNQVAVVGGKTLETMNANARLIAAAPAMYEALKGMVTMYDSLNKSNKHDGACPCYHCQARAALAQADGKQ